MLEIKKISIDLIKNFSSNWFFKILKKNNFKNKNKYFSLEDYIKSLLVLFTFKDCNIFLNWLKFIFEKIDLKFHKNFINYIVHSLSYFNTFLLKNLNCLGLKIIFNGKIGISGGVKTKRNIFKLGINSLNNKHLKIEFQKIQIKTKSGTLGVKFFLIY